MSDACPRCREQDVSTNAVDGTRWCFKCDRAYPEDELEARPSAPHYPYRSTPNAWFQHRHGLWHWECTRCGIGGHGFDTEAAAAKDFDQHQLDAYRKEIA